MNYGIPHVWYDARQDVILLCTPQTNTVLITFGIVEAVAFISKRDLWLRVTYDQFKKEIEMNPNYICLGEL